MVGSAGVGVTPGPSHWMSGVPASISSRVTEQVRVTVSPAMMVEEGEEVREMVTGSVEERLNSQCTHVLFCTDFSPRPTSMSTVTLSLWKCCDVATMDMV